MTTNSRAAAPEEIAPPLPARPLGPLLLALAVVLVWGTSFSFTRVAVQEIPPLSLAFLRFLLASLFLWPLTHRRLLRTRIAPADRPALFGLGFIGVTLYFAFENFGLKYTTASHGALIIATIPLCTELTETLRRRRLPSLSTLAGLGVSLAGVFLIFGRDSGGGATLEGDMLIIGAVVTWVWYTYLADRLVNRYPNLVLTHWIMLVGTATLLPGAAAEYLISPFGLPSAGAWGGLAFLGIFCSALAYHFWNLTIPALGVTTTNNLLYGIPLVGVLTGILALGEPLTLTIVLGGALIIGGVVLASRRPGGKERQEKVLQAEKN